MKRVYAVRGSRAASYGVVIVSVPDSVITLRGEKQAVAQAAWYKLLGKNELGEDVDKKSPTRKIIVEETFSRLERERPDVYQLFFDSITIHWLRNEP